MTQMDGLHKILKHYGITSQLEKLMEESNELHEVLLNMNNYKSKHHFLRALNDEIADVLVLIEQIKLFYGSDIVIHRIMEHKIERTIFEIEMEDNLE